jgi:hypothetical protein
VQDGAGHIKIIYPGGKKENKNAKRKSVFGIRKKQEGRGKKVCEGQAQSPVLQACRHFPYSSPSGPARRFWYLLATMFEQIHVVPGCHNNRKFKIIALIKKQAIIILGDN